MRSLTQKCCAFIAPVMLIGVLAGCGKAKPKNDSVSGMPELSGTPNYPNANGSAGSSKAENHTIEAIAVRKKHQTSSNGKWVDVHEIAVELDIKGKQAGSALNFFDFVVDEIVVDGKPAARADRFGMAAFDDRTDKIRTIERGPNRSDDQSPKGSFVANLRIKAEPDAKKIDRISGSVKLELPGGDWIRITNFDQGPIDHPQLAAMNIPAGMYRPHSTVVGIEFREEPPYLRVRLVDADGNDLTPNTGSSKSDDSYLVTFSPGREIPEGAAVEMTFEPLPVVEIPFVVENIEVKSEKQAAQERAAKERAAAANFKTVATGSITLGGDEFVIKDVFVTNKRIFPNDYTVLLFDFPLTDKERDYLTRKGSFVATTVGNKKRSPTPEKWDFAVIELNIDFERNRPTRKLDDVEDGAFRFMAKRVFPGTMKKKEMLKHFQDINLDNGILTVKSKSGMQKNGVDYSWDFQIQCMPITEQ